MNKNYDTWEDTERALTLMRVMIDHIQTTYRKDKHVDEQEPYLKEVRKMCVAVAERRNFLLQQSYKKIC